MRRTYTKSSLGQHFVLCSSSINEQSNFSVRPKNTFKSPSLPVSGNCAGIEPGPKCRGQKQRRIREANSIPKCDDDNKKKTKEKHTPSPSPSNRIEQNGIVDEEHSKKKRLKQIECSVYSKRGAQETKGIRKAAAAAANAT